MTGAEIYTALRDYVVRELLHGEDTGLDQDTPLLEWGVIDSLAMVGLLSFIGERFGLHLPDDQVRPENFQNLGSLSVLIARQLERGVATPGRGEAARRELEEHGIARSDPATSMGTHPTLAVEGREPAWVFVSPSAWPVETWVPILQSLAGESRAVAVELAAAGTFARQVTALEEIVERFRAGPVLLIGASVGGLVAAEVARRRPGAVRGVALVGIGRMEPARLKGTFLEIARSADLAVERIYQQKPATTERLRAAFERSFGPAVLDAFFDDAACRQAAGLGDPAPRHALFIAGEDDGIVPRSAVEQAARAAASRCEWIPRCGHLVHEERPHELLLILRRFAAEIAPQKEV